MDQLENQKNTTKIVDQLEAVIFSEPQIDCPVIHRFTPGLYIRETFLPAGTILTSKIHKTEHPYVVSKGTVKVWTEESGIITIEAPYSGITKPGTRRILRTITDTIWTTFHPTDKTEVDEIEEEIIEKHDNKFIDQKFEEAFNELN